MIVSEKECPVNEAFSSCRANNCQDTCANPNLRLECRDLTCENGCVCTAGHVRDHNDVCIPLGLCGGGKIHLWVFIDNFEPFKLNW